MKETLDLPRIDEIIRQSKLRETLSFPNLIKLVESSMLEIANSNVLTEEAEEKEVCLLIPDFRIDPSWMSIDEGNYSEEKKKLLMAFRATQLPRDIDQLESFVSQINTILSDIPDVSDHSKAVSRIQVLRIFYNLAKAPDETIAGFLFESLMALAFSGPRIDPDDREQGVVDVVFPKHGVSLKFIDSKRTDIKGSVSKMLKALKQHREVKYIVADKRGDTIEFYEFIVNDDDRSPNSWKNLPGAWRQEEGAPGARFRASLSRLSSIMYVRKMQTLNLAGVENTTERILSALNAKFENLLSTLVDLNSQVNQLLYTTKDPKKVKSQASKTVKKAQATKDSAEKISKK